LILTVLGGTCSLLAPAPPTPLPRARSPFCPLTGKNDRTNCTPDAGTSSCGTRSGPTLRRTRAASGTRQRTGSAPMPSPTRPPAPRLVSYELGWLARRRPRLAIRRERAGVRLTLRRSDPTTQERDSLELPEPLEVMVVSPSARRQSGGCERRTEGGESSGRGASAAGLTPLCASQRNRTPSATPAAKRPASPQAQSGGNDWLFLPAPAPDSATRASSPRPEVTSSE
jgi:hypothetical protein